MSATATAPVPSTPAQAPPESRPPDPTLRVEKLSVTYRTPSGEVPAVRDATFSVGHGECVALVGESGSGKSTLGMAVSGYLTDPHARVEHELVAIEGSPVDRRTIRRLPRASPGVGMLFQDAMTSLDPVWTVGSQLRAAIRSTRRVGHREARDVARDWLTRVGLHDTRRVMAARPYEMSGGMRQRVMLAIALSSTPRLLVADEPTSALDASLARESMELLVSLCERAGTALLVITHDITLSADYAHRMMVMYQGEIVEQGRSAQLRARPTHPYTSALFACVPTFDHLDLEELPTRDSVMREAAAR